MSATPLSERHFASTAVVRDIVNGMPEGLTVPFALADGISGAVAVTGIFVTAGLAEIAAGSKAMSLGGYLAARTYNELDPTERLREERVTESGPNQAKCIHLRTLLYNRGIIATYSVYANKLH